MRLLSKSEIAQAKATEQRRDIEEGLKIAKRVDSLREIKVQEEAALEKFRSETLSHINDEIIKKNQELDALEHEVKDLQKRRKEALEPLDKAWEDYRMADTAINQQREEQLAREHQLGDRETDIKEAEKKAKALTHTASLRAADATRRLQQADEALKQAAQARIEAENDREKAAQELDHASTLLINREQSLTLAESNATLREAKIAERERHNREEARRLADMRATLEREQQRRLKKTNGTSI